MFLISGDMLCVSRELRKSVQLPKSSWAPRGEAYWWSAKGDKGWVARGVDVSPMSVDSKELETNAGLSTAGRQIVHDVLS